LAEKGSQAAPAVPRLIELLRDNDQYLVTQALRALEAIGPGAHEAIPILIGLARDEDYFIRVRARAALKAIAPGTAVPMDDPR
jgi:HEAT repeat protein